MRKRKNIFWGLVILLLATSLLATGFNLFQHGPSPLRLALTVLLFFASLSSLSPLNFFGVFMPLSIAAILNADYLNITVQVWPVLIGTFFLSLGLTVLFKKKRSFRFHTHFNDGNSNTFDTHSKNGTFNVNNEETVDGEDIKIETNFNNSSRYVHGDNIRSADLENNFGNLNVYFDEVQFNEDGATIKVDCNFGSMNLYLPRDIKLINTMQASLGSVNQDKQHSEVQTPKVYLVGDVSFGTVKIHFI